MRRSWIRLALLLAIVVGAVLRLWRLPDLPFPPNDSELFFAYYGWSLLHFGIDEFGTRLPLSFPSIGDFKYPGLAYLNMLPAAIFGLSFITARFWAVVSGVALIPVVYVLSLIFFKNKLAAVVASWFIALSPWSLVLSRIGYENHPAMVMITGGVVLLLLGFVKLDGFEVAYKNKKAFLGVAFTLLLLSTFTYAAARVFVPVMLLFLLGYSFIKASEVFKARKVLLWFFIVITVVIALSLVSWQNRGRSAYIVYNKLEQSELERQNLLIHESGISPVKTPVELTRLVHNKYRIMAYHYLEKYLVHFSPDFLFFKGDQGYERIPDSGQLLLVEVLLLPVGFLAMFKGRGLLPVIVVAWLAIAAIPSTLTSGSGINRASLLIPPLALLSGLGFSFLVELVKRLRWWVLVVLIVGVAVSSVYSLYQIFVIKPIHQAWYSEVVSEEMVKEVLRVKKDYIAVGVPKDEYIFFLFYGKVSPVEFLSDSDILTLDRNNPWDRVDRYSNIYFKMAWGCPKSGRENVLYVCEGANVPQNSKVVKVIRYRDKVPAYTFVTFYPVSQMSKPLPELPEGLKYMVDIETAPGREDGIIKEGKEIW